MHPSALFFLLFLFPLPSRFQQLNLNEFFIPKNMRYPSAVIVLDVWFTSPVLHPAGSHFTLTYPNEAENPTTATTALTYFNLTPLLQFFASSAPPSVFISRNRIADNISSATRANASSPTLAYLTFAPYSSTLPGAIYLRIEGLKLGGKRYSIEKK